MDRARHLLRELRDALCNHLTQQLDPSASYKKTLAPYSLYGHHGKGDKETEERRCRRKQGRQKERVIEQETPNLRVSDWLLLIGESYKGHKDASPL